MGRMGFFTKATDLAVLTGAQVAALTFGHPSVDSVVEHFLHVDVSRMAEVAPPLPLQLFGGNTLEFGSSNIIRW